MRELMDPPVCVCKGVWKCKACGATVLVGEAHRADRPTPHASIRALVVYEPLVTPAAHEPSPDDAFSMRHLATDLLK